LQLCARLPTRFGNGNPYHLAWLAVFVSAWYLGLGPSILSLAVGGVGVWYFFSPSQHAFHFAIHGAAMDLTGFFLLSAIVIIFGEVNRRMSAQWFAAESKVVARKSAERELKAINRLVLLTQAPERHRIEQELRASGLADVTELRLDRGTSPRRPGEPAAGLATMGLERDLIARCAALPGDTLNKNPATSPIFRPLEAIEVGLESAVPLYVDGFSQRTGIPATSYVRPDFGRLPADMEKALLRVIQECLTDIHCHSGSATARVRLTKHDGMVTLEVEDENKGVPLASSSSLGGSAETASSAILGLSERMRQLGGTLEVDASRGGTIVRAVVPCQIAMARRAS
jgi:signal transduction histidine kinase